MIFDAQRPVLVTGGAGFIGTNLVDRFLSAGQPVTVFDNLSRTGVSANLAWLQKRHGKRLQCIQEDVRDAAAVYAAVRTSCAVFHLAAQVAVTTSLDAPLYDFDVNARGTLNVLEAIRQSGTHIPMLFTSTNKVYGTLAHIDVEADSGRYVPTADHVRTRGIDERTPLDFHSPYGCSKGAADQYVLDYARVFDIPAVVFRMSCIYGPHQCGTEDQGWVAHFARRALAGATITVFGDGRQVRDALYVDDLVEAMLATLRAPTLLKGRPFNIGGGVENTISLLELLHLLRELDGSPPAVEFRPWRTADQRYYVSDIGRFASAMGWKPRWTVRAGVERLYHALRTGKRPTSLALAAAG